MFRRTIMQSFYYAIRGLLFAFKNERSMWIHTIIALLVVTAALLLRLTLIEWMILLLSIFLVLIAETINTAIEINVDLVTKKMRTRAMMAKDVAAGAVFLSGVNAIIIGIILFVPKVFG
ncbi:MAG: diacylglycerol kinase family protein [Candidatus Margulisiibacteriota bacterium]